MQRRQKRSPETETAHAGCKEALKKVCSFSVRSEHPTSWAEGLDSDNTAITTIASGACRGHKGPLEPAHWHAGLQGVRVDVCKEIRTCRSKMIHALTRRRTPFRMYCDGQKRPPEIEAWHAGCEEGRLDDGQISGPSENPCSCGRSRTAMLLQLPVLESGACHSGSSTESADGAEDGIARPEEKRMDTGREHVISCRQQ